MKLTCTQENLQRGLAIVNHLAGKNTTLPILNNVLIKAEKGAIELSTTNLEIGIKCLVRGKIEKEGAFTVQARLLHEYVNLLPKQAVNIELKDQEIAVQCESYHTTIKGMVADDFPVITSIEKNNLAQINLNDFREALNQVLFAVALDETRPEISGVLFEFKPSKLMLAATDSFRLAEREITLPKDFKKTAKLIVPFKSLQELNRILGEGQTSEQIILSWTDNQIAFEFSGIELISRLIEGQYPDYQQIIPTNFASEIVVNTKELHQLVKSAALFCRAGINDVHLIVNNEKQSLEINASNSQLGENKGEVKAEISGGQNDIVFNYRYVLDGLQNIQTEKSRLKLIDKYNPGVFLPEGKTGYTYIIMPIKS